MGALEYFCSLCEGSLKEQIPLYLINDSGMNPALVKSDR